MEVMSMAATEVADTVVVDTEVAVTVDTVPVVATEDTRADTATKDTEVAKDTKHQVLISPSGCIENSSRSVPSPPFFMVQLHVPQGPSSSSSFVSSSLNQTFRSLVLSPRVVFV